MLDFDLFLRGARRWRIFTAARLTTAFVAFALIFAASGLVTLAKAANAAAQDTQKVSGVAGTVKSVSGNTVVMTSDAGTDVTVRVPGSAKVLRVAPGIKDLKDAQPIGLTDLKAGDRILVRSTAKSGETNITAASIFAMSKGDLDEQHSRERASWQTSGVAGLVSAVDTTGNAITLTMMSLQGKKTVTIRVTSKTTLRRYAPGSVKFDDAKAAPLGEVRVGDQLRARGEKNADSTEITAVEVVSGSFRNISGEVSSVDTAQNTFMVHDLATNKNIMVKITPESQLRKLPTALAQRIAVRLKGEANTSAAGGAGGATNGAAVRDSGTAAGGVPGGSAQSGDARPRGQGMPGAGGGTPDFQQIISRQLPIALADLHKDDAVILVGTEGSGSEVTAITLLAGVEPILQGSPNGASSILSPWSLGGTPGGEAGTQ